MTPTKEGHGLWHVGVCPPTRGELDDAERAARGGGQPARARKSAERRLGQNSSWASRSSGATGPRPATVGRESGHLPRPRRRMGCLDLSPTSRSSHSGRATPRGRARLLSEALAIERESGHQLWLANALELSARLAAADGQQALAVRLYARAALIGEQFRWLTSSWMARPHAGPRRPPIAGRRGGVRGGVGARPRDDPPRGDRPGEPGAGRGRAGHAVAR